MSEQDGFDQPSYKPIRGCASHRPMPAVCSTNLNVPRATIFPAQRAYAGFFTGRSTLRLVKGQIPTFDRAFASPLRL